MVVVGVVVVVMVVGRCVEGMGRELLEILAMWEDNPLPSVDLSGRSDRSRTKHFCNVSKKKKKKTKRDGEKWI